MKYKDFIDWCNDRATDGDWNLQLATECINIIEEFKKIPWWKRNKIWKQIYEQQVASLIVKNQTWCSSDNISSYAVGTNTSSSYAVGMCKSDTFSDNWAEGYSENWGAEDFGI